MITRRATLGGIIGLPAAVNSPASASTEDLGPAFRALVFENDSAYRAALTRLSAHGGIELMSGLILALRFTRQDEAPLIALMQKISGESARESWFDWMLWQEAHPEVRPHPSYRDFKRELLLRIDPNFEDFLRTEHLAPEAMKIRFEEIAWGGVRKDGIPSLDQPNMVSAKEADYLVGSDFVFGVAINGDVRAYPLRIMGWHEMFNDVIGGVPVALAYCTLCGAGILFETRVPGQDGAFVFGSSGFLYRSNKLMFDRQTNSLWNQFTGRPVVGPLVDSGIELRQRPVVIEPWVRWQARNPDSLVLSIDTGHRRDYGSGVVYNKYFSSPDLMFPAQVDDTRLGQKDHVFGIRTFGGAKAWPVTAFEGGRVINDKVGQLDVVLIGDRLGRTVRAYDRAGLEFTATEDPAKVSANGEIWVVTEEHLEAASGKRAPRVAGHVSYWFAWNGYLGAQSEYYDG